MQINYTDSWFRRTSRAWPGSATVLSGPRPIHCLFSFQDCGPHPVPEVVEWTNTTAPFNQRFSTRPSTQWHSLSFSQLPRSINDCQLTAYKLNGILYHSLNIFLKFHIIIPSAKFSQSFPRASSYQLLLWAPQKLRVHRESTVGHILINLCIM